MRVRRRPAGSGLRAEPGFTLPELLVSMAVLSLLMIAFSTLVGATITHSTEITGQSVLQTQGRAAVDELVADLRQAYTGDGTSPIAAFGSNSITFYSPDRSAAFHLRKISYRLSGGVLQRQETRSTNTAPSWTWPGSAGPWASRVDSVQNTDLFTAYDKDGAATTTPADIRSVAVELTVATTGSRGREYTYSGQVTLRADEDDGT